MMNLFTPYVNVINNKTAKCVPVFVPGEGVRAGPSAVADVGKRPRETGQHLIKTFLKTQVTGRVIKTDEKRRMVRKCVVVP
jgi:hypothetical protein